MEDLLVRLLQIVETEANGKYSVFAKKAGIPSATFYNYTKGRMPHSEHLIKIHDVFGINLNWLLAGDGHPYINKEERTESDGPTDLVLIGQIIEHLEELLQEEGTNLPPAKKRRLIELLYKHFKKIGETADKSTTREYLRLVAA